MDLLKDPTASADLPRGGVVVIGNFDGVHRGHQALIAAAVGRAAELDVPAVALTFDPHPEKVLRPQSGLKLLLTRGQRAQLLESLGIEVLIELGFDLRLAALSAQEFAVEHLYRRLAPREVRLGADFRFGAGRAGDVTFLGLVGQGLGFDVVGAEPVGDDHGPISSTRIRQEVARGHVEAAWHLLGRVVFVDGRVYRGERMGRRLGFPTINVEVENESLPAHGVYVTAVHIPSFGRIFASVTNIGVRPTVYENYHVTVESHLLGFAGDVYGEDVRLFFLRRLRDERVFASSMDLVGQIRADVQAAEAHFLQQGLPEKDLVRR
ncbi:MAG: riboflavin biosynthesis protein RibF [Acidobacteria bacterium]|nr:riboflavin biosynthesis protein RibF [Acidobacteriota bacterium]